jgi:hypothetical protein
VLPKNLITSLPYRIVRDRVPEAYYPGSRCTPQDGMGKMVEAAQCLGMRRQWMLYVVYPLRGATSLI